jgi:NlpC/P60 family protein
VSARVSGLSDDHAAHARHLIATAAKVMVRHKNEIHYSQKANRQVGVRRHLSITHGDYPKTCDCSSTAWWMLWDALRRTYGVKDIVCHTSPGWNPDGLVYTGSMYQHGKAVIHDKNLKIGDLIFYGDQGGGVPEHVAVYVGGGKVFSHGSEGGPYILDLDYRGDRRMSRRFI